MNPRKPYCKDCGVRKTPQTTNVQLRDDGNEVYEFKCKKCMSIYKQELYWRDKLTPALIKARAKLISRLALIDKILNERSF